MEENKFNNQYVSHVDAWNKVSAEYAPASPEELMAILDKAFDSEKLIVPVVYAVWLEKESKNRTKAQLAHYLSMAFYNGRLSADVDNWVGKNFDLAFEVIFVDSYKVSIYPE